jgi:putative Holliday junction resolvase
VLLGRRIALDVGKARIGVAISDLHAIISSPQPFIRRDDKAVEAVLSIIESNEAAHVFIGLPLNLHSKFTESTRDCLAFARELQALVSIDVRLLDERFTTTLASDSLRAAGKNSKSQREFIDSAAAAVILDTALNYEKATGLTAGIRVMDFGDEV